MSPAPPIVTSAPGKLFLIGEYAVLEGAPAILTAVDRRARVELSDSGDAHWHFSAPNLDIHRLALDGAGRPNQCFDAELRDRLRVFEAVRNRVAMHLESPLPPLDIHIDTMEFARAGYKMGLGSSAAVAAALTCALLTRAGAAANRAQIARLAIRAHREAQNGTGSGGDVATAVYGGLISYVRDQIPTPLTWPAHLVGMAVVTGTGASTTDLVGRVQAYRDRAATRYAVDMARLTRLSHHLAADPGQARHFIRIARQYFEALTRLDQSARAGIVSPRHHELHALAARHGAVFKCSGAGGGDLGLLFTTTASDLVALRRDFGVAEAAIIELEFGAPGVSIDTGLTGQRQRQSG